MGAYPSLIRYSVQYNRWGLIPVLSGTVYTVQYSSMSRLKQLAIYFFFAKLFDYQVQNPRIMSLHLNLVNGVDVVVDYADTTMTTQTSMANFDGFSLTLKKQSAEIKSTWMCLQFTYPITRFVK